MGLLKNCSLLIVIIAILASIGPYIYFQIDQREFNRRTTASEAAKGNNFKDATVIVTGSSAGIGIPTARVLYENGAKVIMAVRNMNKGNKVRSEILSSVDKNSGLNEDNLSVMKCDLASLKSIQSFSANFFAKYEKLNILINNAGIMGNDEFGLTEDGIGMFKVYKLHTHKMIGCIYLIDVEQQFATNNIGHFYLTQLLTPLLIESANKKHGISRVINVASAAYFGAPFDIKSFFLSEDLINDPAAYSPMQRYGLTKAANIIFAKEFNERYLAKNVYSISLHPGSIKTELQRYNSYLRLLKYVPDIVAMKSVEQGAATQIRVAAMSDEEFIENGGQYYEDCNVASVWRTDILDKELGKLYWALSEKMIETRV